MANNDTYQPEPEDISLARSLNRLIESGEPVSSDQVSLFNALETYKSTIQLRHEAKADSDLWDSIENQIETDTKQSGTTATLFTIRSPYLKIAAAFLVALLISLLYLSLPDSEPEFLATSGANQTRVVLDDGSVVTLRPHSRLKTEESTDAQVTYRIDGEAYFDVTSDASRTFSVVAEEGRVDVLGTRFTVSTWSSDVRVFLEEGRVRFSDSGTGESVTLDPGEYSVLEPGGPATPISGNPETFTGWINNVINLDERTLSDIAEELSHHYDVELVIPDTAASESLSGSIQLDDLNQVLDDLELTLGGEFERISENRYRFRANP
ncbi:FecR family protein [Rhodohalobacter mucosus]|uniref:FecR family protein n=1 Tax=Rhodohalobacter mucosus TaxID=2079485 RepID=A0A316TY45_9BACT|nr:FecR domain-containing protein [Rhodohalobacter mucosus]PWN07702.1 hypothetical protein DDZ15_01380 [Rhodohalobacter mucosus]